MPFGKFLALTFSSLLLTINLLFVIPAFAQEQYYFSDEFNEERTNNVLDAAKWNYYPNLQGCALTTIKETGGSVQLQQCNNKPQFPYFYTKNNPFPAGDFSSDIGFRYTKATFWGDGFALVNKAGENGAPVNYLFGVQVWQDMSGTNMGIFYNNARVYSAAINLNPHVFTLKKQGDVYTVYFDGQIVFTSPQTAEKLGAIWFGNPELLNFNIPEWTNFKVDYVHVKQLIPEGPVPFLDLPWDYGANGMTFNDSSTSINSYFDHEYPLLSTNLTEPNGTIGNVVNFYGAKSTKLFYSSHDGYDYGTPAKVKLGLPVLAAADGEATYMNSCGACGNAILIDHKNGYQTRYYHMQADGLITNIPGQKVNVSRGQQIGKVGFSGNVKPGGEAGSHLHFMVIQDKNKDGNFEDNIPDGITDPFGWQSTDPDPWETYSFNYTGQQRTGNKSYYLFTKKLDNLNSSLNSNAAVFETGKTKLEFPQGATDQNLNIKAESAPNFSGGLLNSLGSILKVEAKNSAGGLVTAFLKNFNLTINFSQFDLSRYNLNTLSIYSSPDGQNWTKENTTVDSNSKTATTSINHLTYFALMAERIDTIAPTTTPILEGEKGTGNNFRSDVKVNLNATDNPGGLGVEFTAYAIGDGDWQTYTSPLNFTDEGNYKISFYSQDKDENIEEIKSVEFSIDKTPPEAKIEVDQAGWDLKVTPTSDEVTVSKKPAKKLNEATYILTDPAGNILTLETYDLDSDNKDVFKLYSLKYNSDKVIPIPSNLMTTTYTYQPKPKQIRIINQSFNFGNQATFTINADAFKNKTLLNIIENRKPRKEEKEGIVLLKLQTNKGKVEYFY